MLKIAFPHPPGIGGPGTFQIRFISYLKREKIAIVNPNSKDRPDIVLVIGGTRRIIWLITCKIRHIPIIYRLDGINWLHRKVNMGFKNYLINELRNRNSKLIHGFIADFIIYQSHFVMEWWSKSCWRKCSNYKIINNGINLSFFKPIHSGEMIRLLCLENTIDYSPYAIKLLNNLRILLPAEIEMDVYGGFNNQLSRKMLDQKINYRGKVHRNNVKYIFKNAIYLSLDIHPACPNSVIEALSCGSPVVAFDTGSLKELVPPEAGIIIPYGSDPWKLDYPDAKALSLAILNIFQKWDKFSQGARSTAEKYFDENLIFKSYLEVINKVINEKAECLTKK